MGSDDFGAPRRDRADLQLGLDAGTERLHVRDDAHRGVSVLQLLERPDSDLERSAVERSEALVEQECLDGEGLATLRGEAERQGERAEEGLAARDEVDAARSICMEGIDEVEVEGVGSVGVETLPEGIAGSRSRSQMLAARMTRSRLSAWAALGRRRHCRRR